MKRPVIHHVDGPRVFVSGPDGGHPCSTFDFDAVGFSRPVADGLIRALIGMHGHNSIESQRLTWRQIRCLAISQSQYGKIPSILPANCIDVLDSWLERSGYSPKTVAATHNGVARLLRWCLRNAPGMISPKVRIFAAAYRPSVKAAEVYPEEHALRAILSACYSEIEEIETRIVACRELPLSEDPSVEGELLLRLLQHGDGHIPSRIHLMGCEGGAGLLRYVDKYGGLQSFAERYYLNIADIFPFYLAILVQTSGNPQSVLSLRRDCVRPHPMRSDLERIVWEKHRAAKEQYADFPKDKAWSAPNLVRRLLSLNEDLMPIAATTHRNELFLCRNAKRGVCAPSWQSTHVSFEKFREKYDLPHFELRHLRKAGAVLHHRAGRSIVAAQRRLNHVSSTTTQAYTPLSDRKIQHDATILKFQGLLVFEATKSVFSKPEDVRARLGTQTQTVFGFTCADPLAGVAPGSKKGEMCSQFCSCATCPGAIVSVDDPSVVARILSARDGLASTQRRAFREGWATRFQAIYAPILGIIESEILPSISESVLFHARALPRIDIMHLE